MLFFCISHVVYVKPSMRHIFGSLLQIRGIPSQIWHPFSHSLLHHSMTSPKPVIPVLNKFASKAGVVLSERTSCPGKSHYPLTFAES